MGSPWEYLAPELESAVTIELHGVHGKVRIFRDITWPGGMTVRILSGSFVVVAGNGPGALVCPRGYRPPAIPPNPLAAYVSTLARRLVRKPAAPAAPAAELPESVDTAEGDIDVIVSAQSRVYFVRCQGPCAMAEADATFEMATQSQVFIN